ncbi:hypothetical protein BZARG_790 [Bizionia argentinensis JUB59]|uniref:Late control protein n=1 Tax=Bizionia argentinensis JUB59 TaxID=1046627 RepID=G2EBA7_9FLAO|nr:hypothetical protein [Bizionia argentinensis]EGV44382.1 hypothetical protein BZARG_790 [Bizionia argentinensis JUB59]
MLNIDWYIEFKNQEGKRFQLALLGECEIISSVDNLADTATIVLPEAVMNEPLNFENKIGRGTEVTIRLGYDENLEDEFSGYIQDITNNDSSLKILCEDALFLFRVGVPDVELKPTSLSQIAQHVIDNIDSSFTVNCDYTVSYEKFTIHQATGYDVLKKIQEETKANIYFDTKNKVLHIHPPYIEKGGEVFYSMQKNIEESSLEFKNKLDTKVEVTIETTDINGNVKKVVSGTTGGDKITLKVRTMDEASMQKIADNEARRATAPGYEGSFDTWLIPFCAPTYSARIKDEDYPDKTAYYYVKSVTTTLSESGGVRTITPGIKLS